MESGYSKKKLIQKILKECKKFASSTEIANDEFIQQIQTDNKSFYVEEQFSQLPIEFQNKFSFLSDFCKSNPFAEKNTELIKKMNKAVKDRLSGIIYIFGMPEVEKIKKEMYENVKFIFENNLLISLSDEFKNYIKNSLFIWLESYAHNINNLSNEHRISNGNIYYSFTCLDVILISETFSYEDMDYIDRLINFKTLPFNEEDILKTYIKNQIEDYIKTFCINSNNQGASLILRDQQIQRIRLLLTVSSYLIKDSEFARYIIKNMPHLKLKSFKIRNMKPIIENWVINSSLDRQSAVDIIEDWFISYIKEFTSSVKNGDKNSIQADFFEFVHVLFDICDDNTVLNKFTMETIELLKYDSFYITTLNPLYRYFNNDVKEYIDSFLSIDSIDRLIYRYGDQIPSDLNIDSVVENTLEAMLTGKNEDVVVHRYDNQHVEKLVADTIIVMLRKGISIKKYIGKNHHYDFWFDFERFDKKDFEIDWLNYYPNDILDMIKNNEKRCTLVLESLNEDAKNSNIDGCNLKRRYYVYRYLTRK